MNLLYHTVSGIINRNLNFKGNTDSSMNIQTQKKIILASKSPRRAELIRLLGYEYETAGFETDETFSSSLSAEENCIAAACGKAGETARRRGIGAGEIIIGADTAAVCGGSIFTKPKDRSEAYAMLKMFSGRSHDVISGVCILCEDSQTAFSTSTKVFFSELSCKEINDYIDTGEPFDKAGGYAVQGGAAKFITSVDGCFYNVMGLPLSAIYQHLKDIM